VIHQTFPRGFVFLSAADYKGPEPSLLAGCGKTMLVCLVHLVYLVCFVYLVDLVHLVSFAQPNKRDKPNKPNNRLLTLADFFRSLLGFPVVPRL
jgi:hypothetical protein